ncbi:MAG: phosphatidylserine decarboxylase family protein [Candidatus Riflebacteria bacterium]|nr:phosphatidylserine decarboxylase family protein [Candidatus Riflebacteria bacterium]
MRSPVHPEALPFVILFSVSGAVLGRICRYAGWLMAGMAIFTLYFFRDPEREIPQGENLIVSPADGRVLRVDQVDHAPFIEGPAKRVIIFLSVFNVHINRAPIEGKVAYRHYHAGKFLPANVDKASTDNEQNSIGIDDGGYKVLVRQIAGIIARRIVCWKDAGDSISRGERFGLIRFGSRTEIFLPLSAHIDVERGDKVHGGSTIIGRRC